MPTSFSASHYRRRRALRILRALAFTFGSGGVLLWLTARRIHAVARLASCRAPGAAIVVVPGYRLAGGEVPPPFAARLSRALQLWRRDRARILLLSGAAAHPDGPSEAAGGLALLCDLGLPPDARVVLDSLARDTDENLRNAAGLLERSPGSDNPPADVVIVSNRWHLARCAWHAEQLGLPWRICAAERRWQPHPFALVALLREAASLLSFAGPAAARIDPHRLMRLHR